MEDVVGEVESLRTDDHDIRDDPQVSGEGDKENGLISHILSRLVSKGEAVEEAKDEKEGQSDQSEEKESGGGILDHLVSTLVAPSPRAAGDGRTSEVGEVEEKEPCKQENQEAEGGGSGGNGIIDTIVCRLPISLSGDAAPTTDEASILIHSIVHD